VVNVYAVVRDKNKRLVPSLKREDFELEEDDRPQEIHYFSRETDTPLSLAILIDTSPSQERTLRIEQENAKRFVREVVRPNDLAMVVHFDLEVETVHHLTADHDLLEGVIDEFAISGFGRGESTTTFPSHGPFPGPLPGPFPSPTWNLGYTHLLDAVYLASKELRDEIGRKAVLLIGDGVDIGSKVDLNTALQAAHKADTMIYCLTVLDDKLHTDFCRKRREYYHGLALLRKLSEETGGRVISVRRARDTAKAFQEIGEELRTQYFLGYTPLNALHDGNFRKIRVQVHDQAYIVQARNGYYAPTE
jgi:VWFA-related protein